MASGVQRPSGRSAPAGGAASAVRILLVAGLMMAWLGCATAKVTWDARIGQYTFDQAVLELGPPDKAAKLSDGSQVCEWLTHRGSSQGGVFVGSRVTGIHHYSDPPTPDYFLRLTFDPEGKLTAWKDLIR